MTEKIDDNQKGIVKKAVQDFVDAQLQDKEPDIDEFVKQYPGLEHQIRQSIKDMQRINTLFDSIVQADESDFENVAAKQNLVGEKVGSFEIVDIIGSGGMGVVYLARDTRLDRSVAIKSIPIKRTESSTARLRFKREAKLLASLNHPNIAVIHDIVEQDDGDDYLVLEYIPGRTLAELIANEPLKLEKALSIAQQIAQAVSAAHKKGIIHRDLKPGNIKITPEDSVKVLDFGLAKSSVSEDKDIEITASEPGRIIGTPAYMSPEQARGKDIDRRTDIWSFGCILYEMLTGKFPFDGKTATDTLVRIIEHQPDWELMSKDIPENIVALLKRCLEKEPNRRLGDIADAAVEINDTMSKSASVQIVVTKLTKTRKAAMIIGGVAVCIIIFSIALKLIPQNEIQLSPKEIRLVVLPFENLGPTEEEWFADGMTDEITTRLAGIHGLAVISRQSAIMFKKMGLNTQIAKEFNLDYFIEGTIQCNSPSSQNSQVRIRIQLIRTADDTYIWQDTYDKDMSNIFQLQTDIAERVAQALDITLLEPERKSLTSGHISNTEAYIYYVRGREYLGKDTPRAIEMYERAIELDPNYAQAYAALSNAHTSLYWFYDDRSEERLTKAEKAARRALELDPDLPEAHIALGRYYYQGHLDFERALQQYEIARKSLPENASVLRWTGLVQKRQGKFADAQVNLERAYELDPTNIRLLNDLAHNLRFLRRYDEAVRHLDRLILLAPDEAWNYVNKAEIYLLWRGDIDKARAILDDARLNISETVGSFFRLHDLDVTLDIYSRNYREVLNKLLSKPQDYDDMVWFIPNVLRLAEVYGYLGNEQLEQKYYKSAVAILEEKVSEDPNDCRFHSALGKAYAGLGGREQDAIEEGKLGIKYRPVEKDASNGTLHLEDLVRIYVMVSKYDEAIYILKDLLSMPSELSVYLLRLNPVWDPLRNHPHFKELMDSDK